MNYYIGTVPFGEDDIQHYGVLGMKWGVRKDPAKAYEKANAAVVVSDSKMMKKPSLLLDAVLTLLRSPRERDKLSANLHGFTKENAAESLANMVISVAKEK